ncbi:curli-like amyloid fiber formation chaperone CsgH [Devosia faecipullorum]|uniref:curli-like amyloid fiber formation chaperone CsgH n=1 Tax=Devosia faecipullorum TaxID=2755039 RepID=UPI00187B5DF7|nr:curli-like amyloid fiber formation chaperone CsgH [Devosia faecipullorum]MBE7732097.1 hypothetical protein [Devosia faecipullorum]
MLRSPIRLGLVALLALGGAAVAANANGNAGSSDITCGITTATDRGMMAIEGVLQSPDALHGEYRFALRSSGAGGSTNINQGGQFSASPGMLVSLGKVMVNAGSVIEADFTITTGGKKFDCSSQI